MTMKTIRNRRRPPDTPYKNDAAPSSNGASAEQLNLPPKSTQHNVLPRMFDAKDIELLARLAAARRGAGIALTARGGAA